MQLDPAENGQVGAIIRSKVSGNSGQSLFGDEFHVNSLLAHPVLL
jgi:hypothetical protein